jgi:hypothetical protein
MNVKVMDILGSLSVSVVPLTLVAIFCYVVWNGIKIESGDFKVGIFSLKRFFKNRNLK